jgi:aspartate kinase
MSIACKFGGSSVASSEQIQKVRGIVDANLDRRYIVVSAPGKRHDEDQKVTDLLYLAHETAKAGLSPSEIIAKIGSRYQEIVDGLNVKLDISKDLEEIQKEIGTSRDYAASRGEYLNGKVISAVLGASFIDPIEHIFMDGQGNLEEEKTYKSLGSALSGEGRYVIPGFYASSPEGEVVTFSRGGSDITGAIVARSVQAEVYENWTDVCGLLMADPRVVDSPRNIEEVSYYELRELSYMGAQVLHDEAIFPVKSQGIPIHLRNTNEPEHPGTRIVDKVKYRAVPIVGLAGKKDFEIIYIQKTLMNKIIGFGRRLLGIFESHQISFEHLPSGIDNLSVVVSSDSISKHRDSVLADIRKTLDPDEVTCFEGIALIAVVGAGMAFHPGIAATVLKALADEGVNVRLMDQGASELSIIIGVENPDFDRALNSIYKAFIID